MDDQQQDVMDAAGSCQVSADRQVPCQVKSALGPGLQETLQILAIQAALHNLQEAPVRWSYDLPDLKISLVYARSQCLVPAHDVVDGRRQGLGAQRARHVEGQRDVV